MIRRGKASRRIYGVMAKDSVTMILHDSSQERYTGYKSGSTDIHTARVVYHKAADIQSIFRDLCSDLPGEYNLQYRLSYNRCSFNKDDAKNC